MIVTERFVFLHLHKSGGTFVNECLLRFLPGARRIGYHFPRSLIPAEAAGLPVFGLVRSPWSYYVSWFSFQSARREPNALFRLLSDGGRLDFGRTLRNMLELGSSPVHLEPLLQALPLAYGDRGINLPGFALAPIRDSGLGFYAYLYQYMFGSDGSSLTIGRMETLRQELPRMLTSVGQSLPPAMLQYIEQAEPRNAVKHGHYVDYYDRELRDLVAERDAPIIARHGFRFGD